MKGASGVAAETTARHLEGGSVGKNADPAESFTQMAVKQTFNKIFIIQIR